MEGSQISGRSSGWKNSIIKKEGQDSRIISDSKEFPSKFSPSKNIEVKTRLRSNMLNHSHDEIVVGERRRSDNKDSQLYKRPTIVETPSSKEQQIKLSFKNIPSEGSLSIGALSPRKNMKVTQDSMEYLHDVKLQYIRFKDKVMKEIKKLQNDIKSALEEVMSIVEKHRPRPTQLAKSPSFQTPKAPTFSMPASLLESTIKPAKPSQKTERPPSVFIDTEKYRDLATSDAQIESVLPKIKDRMSTFFDLMGQLKTEINEQAMYSPVGTKAGQFRQ